MQVGGAAAAYAGLSRFAHLAEDEQARSRHGHRQLFDVGQGRFEGQVPRARDELPAARAAKHPPPASRVAHPLQAVDVDAPCPIGRNGDLAAFTFQFGHAGTQKVLPP